MLCKIVQTWVITKTVLSLCRGLPWNHEGGNRTNHVLRVQARSPSVPRRRKFHTSARPCSRRSLSRPNGGGRVPSNCKIGWLRWYAKRKPGQAIESLSKLVMLPDSSQPFHFWSTNNGLTRSLLEYLDSTSSSHAMPKVTPMPEPYSRIMD